VSRWDRNTGKFARMTEMETDSNHLSNTGIELVETNKIRTQEKGRVVETVTKICPGVLNRLRYRSGSI